MEHVSFAKSVKEEITTLEIESLAKKRALLAGYIRINGSLLIRNKHSILRLPSENAKISKYIYSLLIDVYQCDVHIDFPKKAKRTLYVVSVNSKADVILDDLDINFLEGKISKNIVYNDETIAGYLTGVFLATGSINSPNTSNYHMELSINDENHAKWISHLFPRYKHTNIEPKITKRREKHLIYFKKSDQIAEFLLMMGAVSSCMEFENVRIDRDYRNSANRLTNLDTANMTKTVEAGKRQAKEIKELVDKIGLNNLGNQKIQMVAKYRMDYEASPLEEIASMVSEELDEDITKSNVNHILRKLHEMYIKL